MSFLDGRVTYQRFRVAGPAPRLFAQTHLDALADRAAGRQRVAAADGVEVGWTASKHVLDTDFQFDKNVVNDSLHFDLRVDADKLPPELMKAYYEVELKGQMDAIPGGRATAKTRRHAREAARDRLEEEAKDGRYRKRKCFPVMWDRTTGEVLFGATSLAQIDRLCSLFEQTFQMKLEAMPASNRAVWLMSETDAMASLGLTEPCDVALSAFVPGVTPSGVAWIPSEHNRDFLGNEFLLWLWYFTDVESDTLRLADGSECAVMIARKLTLECPRGQTGADAFAHEGPTRLPEARLAIQAGKLPRKCGLTVVRHDQQYELTLSAETLAVTAAKLPPPPEDVTDARAKLDARVDSVRALVETLDGVYTLFLARRLGREWAADLAGMQAWLRRAERVAGAA